MQGEKDAEVQKRVAKAVDGVVKEIQILLGFSDVSVENLCLVVLTPVGGRIKWLSIAHG